MTVYRAVTVYIDGKPIARGITLSVEGYVTKGAAMSYSDNDYNEMKSQLTAQLAEYRAALEKVSEAACQIGWVLEPQAKHVLVTMGGAIMAANKPNFQVRPGDAVRVIAQTMQIVEPIKVPELGPVVRVGALVDAAHCEVEFGAERRLILLGECRPEEGDRVVLDGSGRMAMRVLPADKKAPSIAKAITWDDIGGHVDAKRELIDAIDTPFKNPGIYQRYGQRPIKGALLHGPAGTGKTLLAKAVSSSLAATHQGRGVDTAFIYVKGPEVINKYVGQSESNVRDMFEGARAHKKKHGYPAVIFIDEAEALLGHRADDRGSVGYMARTVVPAFLAEMDGLEESAAFVLLATNLPTALDPAVVRDGRIDRKIKIGRPDAATAAEIFALHLRGKPTKGDNVAEAGAAAMYDAARVLFHVETRAGQHPVTLADVASGAMIEGVVARATQLAIRREIETKKKGALTARDVVDAVDAAQREVADTDHRGTLAEMGLDHTNIRSIKRAPRAAAEAQPAVASA